MQYYTKSPSEEVPLLCICFEEEKLFSQSSEWNKIIFYFCHYIAPRTKQSILLSLQFVSSVCCILPMSIGSFIEKHSLLQTSTKQNHTTLLQDWVL